MKARITSIIGEPPARREHVRVAYYKQAMHFEIAADVLQSSNQHFTDQLPEGFHAAIPAVVCHALAVELFLKCLLQFEDQDAKGHDLGELFQLLTHDHQSRIERAYKSHATAPFDTFTVLDILARSGDAFSEWRYLNEQKPPAKGGMYDAALALPSIKEVIWQEAPVLKTVM